MRNFASILTLVVMLALMSPAAARDLTATYVGDADEELYREISQAVFDYLPDYECGFEESHDPEAHKEFRKKHKLEDSMPVIAASCKFSGHICFSGRGMEVCFDHGGLMIVDTIKLSRKDKKAKAELSYLLADEENKGAGIAFAFVDLKKEEAGWVAQKWQATGAIDFKALDNGKGE